MDENLYDVVIVGAGQAGCALAIKLSELGVKTILLEAQDLPQSKPCSGYLSPKALSQLEGLGCRTSIDLASVRDITTSKLYLNRTLLVSAEIAQPTHGNQCGIAVPQEKLLEVLLERAIQSGASIKPQCLVIGFERKPDHVEVIAEQSKSRVKISTKLLVGADGAHSIIAKLSGQRVDDPRYRLSSISSYVEGLTLPHKLIFYDKRFYPGFGWIIPHVDGKCHFGVAINDEAIRRAELCLESFYKQFLLLIKRLAGARDEHIEFGKMLRSPIRAFGGEQQAHFDGGIMIGEAAGFVNPTNGEGIAPAYESAAIAAEVIGECFSNSDFTKKKLAEHHQRCNQTFALELAASDLFASLSRNRAMMPFCISLLKSMSKAANIDASSKRVAGGILGGALSVEQSLTGEALLRAISNSPLLLWDQVGNSNFFQNPEILRNGKKLLSWQVEFTNQMLNADGWGRQWAGEIARKQTRLIAAQAETIRHGYF